MARPIGSTAKLNGKTVRWAGDEYGWQSPGSYSNLEKQGRFKFGRKELDVLGRYLGPLAQRVAGFQQQVRAATPWLDPVENTVNRAVKADDKLPSSRVAAGGAVAAQTASNALNLDPRIGMALPFLVGAVHTSGPRAGTTKLQARRDIPVPHDQLEDALEAAYKHQNTTGSLKGYNKHIADLPNNQQAVIYNRGNINFSNRDGLTVKVINGRASKPAARTVPPPPPPVPAKPSLAAAKPTNLDVPSSIIDPRYMGVTAPFIEAIESRAEELKQYALSHSKSAKPKAPKLNRVINMFYGEPNPQYFWEALKDVDPEDYKDLGKLLKHFETIDSKMGSLASKHGYAPQYIEGHHPVQVESVALAGKHLPFEDRLRFTHKLHTDYTYGGSDPGDMFQLTTIGHRDANSGNLDNPAIPRPLNAHASIHNADLVKDGFPAQTGDNWSSIDFSHINDVDELAETFWRQSGEPQMRFAELAHDQKPELDFRTHLATQLNVRERDLYTIFSENGPSQYKDKLKELGVDAPKVKQLMQQYYFPQ